MLNYGRNSNSIIYHVRTVHASLLKVVHSHPSMHTKCLHLANQRQKYEVQIKPLLAYYGIPHTVLPFSKKTYIERDIAQNGHPPPFCPFLASSHLHLSLRAVAFCGQQNGEREEEKEKKKVWRSLIFLFSPSLSKVSERRRHAGSRKRGNFISTVGWLSASLSLGTLLLLLCTLLPSFFG